MGWPRAPTPVPPPLSPPPTPLRPPPPPTPHPPAGRGMGMRHIASFNSICSSSGGSRPPSLGLERRQLKLAHAQGGGASASRAAAHAPNASNVGKPFLSSGRYTGSIGAELASRRDGNAAARARNFMDHKFHVSMSHQEQIRAEVFLTPTHPFLPYVAPHFSQISPFYSSSRRSSPRTLSKRRATAGRSHWKGGWRA